MHRHHSVTFHPVGQGLLTSGWVVSDLGNGFRHWIYDCGTSSSQGLVENALDQISARPHNVSSHVDVVAVSHFDKDHVSGLVSLLKRVSVGSLLLPYMPLARRVAFAFSMGHTFRGRAMQFTLNPGELISALKDVSVERLILVPGGTGEVPDAERRVEENRNAAGAVQVATREPRDEGEASDVDAIQRALGARGVVRILAENSSIGLEDTFELVPYNDATLSQMADQPFIDEVTHRRAALLSGPTDGARVSALEALKVLYDNRFGRSSEKRNIISLFLYAGPSAWRGDARAFIRAEVTLQRGRLPHIFEYMEGRDEKSGVLFCGDGYLNTSDRLERLIQYFGRGRILRLGCLQVMHHGSIKNWHPAVPQRLAPSVSVFSSDPTHKRFRHPSNAVWQSFQCLGPAQVDKQRGLRVDFCARDNGA